MNYTTRGLAHGECHHVHKTLVEANDCRCKYLAKHELSDRCVVRLEGSKRVLLNAHEALEVIRLAPAKPTKTSR